MRVMRPPLDRVSAWWDTCRLVCFEARVLKSLGLILAHLILIAPLSVALAALLRLQAHQADLLVQFTAPALIACVGFGLLLLLFRLYPAALSALVISGLLVWANWPQWQPAASAPAPASPRFTLYSANLWGRNHDVEMIERSIKAANADILILIEISPEVRSQSDRLFADYPHRLYAGGSHRPASSAVISRYPLVNVPGTKHPETVAAFAETPLGPIHLMAAHLTRPWPFQPHSEQARQVEVLRHLRQNIQGPVILAGDFNAVSHGAIGRHIQTDLGLTPAPALLGTYPAFLPSPLAMAIDHVWHTPDLNLTRRLGQKNGSDHRPVIVQISRAAPPRP